jgi:hypothetical protein
MSNEQQESALVVLRAEADKGITPRATRARTALHYLEPGSVRMRGREAIVRVDDTLVTLADSEDRFLRELVAMAFNFWDGPQAEATLLKLAQDSGRGTLLRVQEND